MTTIKTFRAFTSRTVYEIGDFDFELEVEDGLDEDAIASLAFDEAELLLKDAYADITWEYADINEEEVT